MSKALRVYRQRPSIKIVHFYCISDYKNFTNLPLTTQMSIEFYDFGKLDLG